MDAAQKKDDPKPIEKERVHVEVEPKDKDDSSDRDYGRKVKENVKRQVKEAIEKNKDGGQRKQVDAVDDVIDTTKKRVNPGKVEKVRVKVEGETSDGDTITHERTVKPDGKDS